MLRNTFFVNLLKVFTVVARKRIFEDLAFLDIKTLNECLAVPDKLFKGYYECWILEPDRLN